ncbi:hypothetical protein APECO18_21330 [Escherichia coli APEC O18]|nr:hypothetical protein APECO18_21330 [Escherichia coli APEC O18]DAL19614.1 MAG TPA_asm: hypothetical protein [Bacteriophage sp.]
MKKFSQAHNNPMLPDFATASSGYYVSWKIRFCMD